MNLFRTFVIAVLAVSVAAPDALAASSKRRTKITVHNRLWHGYGFLPGYRPQPAETNGVPVLGEDPRRKRELRYIDWYGHVRYGWGRPGYYHGRYNGGSFGPCWVSTPIGMNADLLIDRVKQAGATSIVMAGLVPAIHVFDLPATSAGMTSQK